MKHWGGYDALLYALLSLLLAISSPRGTSAWQGLTSLFAHDKDKQKDAAGTVTGTGTGTGTGAQHKKDRDGTGASIADGNGNEHFGGGDDQATNQTVKHDPLQVLEEEWWEIERTGEFLFDAFPTSKFYLRFEDLDDSSLHSCYEYKVIDPALNDQVTHYGSFCYPVIVITGVRKSSTSALYNLIKDHPQTINTDIKENCAYQDSSRSIIQYFNSLPRNIENSKILFDGCPDMKGNMKMRKMLRNPNTFYILLLRDYSDWIWSAYNYWCNPLYEKECSTGNYWTDTQTHIRTPEIFHDIVQGSMNGTLLSSPLLFDYPCQKASNMFKSYLNVLWDNVPVKQTLVLASEDLEDNPGEVWSRIAQVRVRVLGLGLRLEVSLG